MLPEASLTPTMLGIAASRAKCSRFHVDPRAPLHAIDDDREAGGFSDCLVVLVQPFLGGLVVVGCDGEDAIDARHSELVGELDDFARVVTARASQHRNAAPGFFDRDLDNAQVFVARESRAFAGGATRDQKI